MPFQASKLQANNLKEKSVRLVSVHQESGIAKRLERMNNRTIISRRKV